MTPILADTYTLLARNTKIPCVKLIPTAVAVAAIPVKELEVLDQGTCDGWGLCSSSSLVQDGIRQDEQNLCIGVL